MRRISALIAVSALLFVTAAPAFAGGDAPEKTGLPGTTWAVDCKKPVSEENFYVSYRIGANGNLLETLKGFPTEQDREITNIQVISPSWMIFTIHTNEYLELLVFTGPDGRKKTWRSVGQDGKVYIQDGELTMANGSPPWFEKCPAEKNP
jgi:hypothetical protein